MKDVLTSVVRLRLNIFHSKFNWRIFYKTDSWISCLKFKQILINNITITSRYINPPWFLLGEYKTTNLYCALRLAGAATWRGGRASAGAAATVCGFRWSTETHCRVAPTSRSSFFLSLTITQYGPRYVASSGPVTAPTYVRTPPGLPPLAPSPLL